MNKTLDSVVKVQMVYTLGTIDILKNLWKSLETVPPS